MAAADSVHNPDQNLSGLCTILFINYLLRGSKVQKLEASNITFIIYSDFYTAMPWCFWLFIHNLLNYFSTFFVFPFCFLVRYLKTQMIQLTSMECIFPWLRQNLPLTFVSMKFYPITLQKYYNSIPSGMLTTAYQTKNQQGEIRHEILVPLRGCVFTVVYLLSIQRYTPCQSSLVCAIHGPCSHFWKNCYTSY